MDVSVRHLGCLWEVCPSGATETMVMGNNLGLTTFTSGLVQEWPGPREGFTYTCVICAWDLEMLQDSMCHAFLCMCHTLSSSSTWLREWTT